ncbi:TonB-dependent receptor [Colwellia psychrerythraea]|uniref:Putative TonB-dependent receptor n=1 Tax=Colwellia psychrerythraea (strain 34H / ATCC BAA-681) TaxID=167879 RepID=Q488U7_COLP3|nr:TonB-dependent receptor [Colwellia psychrerythraea]AAZ25234.1 putative TonB-dependent receptor [Colwellia psychrerythraea 34H]
MNILPIAKSIIAMSVASALLVNNVAAEELNESTVDTKDVEVIEVRGGQRVKTLREVPASVSVISGESLSQMKINKLDDLSQSLPNVSISENAVQDTISIRGVNSDLQAGGEQSVGIFLDGVYHGRGVQSRFSFMDVDAIEVLRGPQGSLFGKNTVGGVISILPAQPKDYFEAKLTAAYEFEYEKVDYSGYVTGALNESGSLTGRFAFKGSNSEEGWVENEANGETMPTKEDSALRGILNWQVNDDFKVNLRAENGTFETKGAPYEILYLEDSQPITGLARMFGAEANIDGKTNISNGNYPGLGFNGEETPYFMDANFSEYALKSYYKIDQGTISATIAQSNLDFVRSQDADFGPLPVIQFSESEDYQQNSVELRFVSEDNDDFEYLFGVFWQNSDLLVDAVADFATAPGTPVAGAFPIPIEHAVTSRFNELEQETDSLALFGQVTFGLTESLKLELSGRYSKEEKTGRQTVEVYGGTGDGSKSGLPLTNPTELFIWSQAIMEAFPHSVPVSREENLFSPSASLTWLASDSASFYVSVSKGFKGGGFNAIAMSPDLDEIEYENEEAISSEIGGKFEFFDGTVLLNTAIFNVAYDNMQTTLFTGGTTFVVENAAKATSRGLEAELRWLINDEFTLDANLGYIDFEFDDYKNAGCTAQQVIDSGLTGSACAAAGLNDLSGKTNQDVPEITLSLSLQHEFAINEYVVTSRIDSNYVDDFFATADLDPITVQEAYIVWNAAVSIASSDGLWKTDLIFKNITDESYFYYANDVPLFAGSQFASFSQPSTVTLQFSYLFE